MAEQEIHPRHPNPDAKMVAQAIEVLTFTFRAWGGVQALPPPPHLASPQFLDPHISITSLDSVQAESISFQHNKPDLGRPSPTNISRYAHNILDPE